MASLADILNRRVGAAGIASQRASEPAPLSLPASALVPQPRSADPSRVPSRATTSASPAPEAVANQVTPTEKKYDRLAGVRFTQHLDSYRQFHEVERETIKQRVIDLLREWGPEEKTLVGKQAICVWFASMGIGNRLGQYASWGCVTGWRKRLACPIWRGKGPKAPAWTTDVLLRAWLLSLFSTDNPGGPRIQRRHWNTDLQKRREGSADRPSTGAGSLSRAGAPG